MYSSGKNFSFSDASTVCIKLPVRNGNPGTLHYIEDEHIFLKAIMQCKKGFVKLSSAVGKSVHGCICYYYGTF